MAVVIALWAYWQPTIAAGEHMCKFEYLLSYSSANKIFAVLRRNRSDPLSRAMGCVGELRAGSRSAGYKYSLLMHCIKIKSPVKFLLNE